MSLARKIGALFGTGTTIDSANLMAAANVPAGTVTPFAGATAPTDWLFCYGQAVSRSTYAALFTAIGVTHGAGDGSTTFTLPDMRGRVPGGKDDMGGSAASRLSVTITGTKASTSNGNITGLSSTAGLAVGMKAFGTGIGTNAVISAITSGTAVTLSVNSTSTGSAAIRFAVVDGATLGASGGSHIHQLSMEQMPAHDHTGASNPGGSYGPGDGSGSNVALAATNTSISGSGQSHPIMQPTIVMNYIIKTLRAKLS